MTSDKSSGSGGGWFEVWARRRLDPARGSLLAQLLAADGFDTAFSSVEEANWIAYVRHWIAELAITSETSVFEVGCGAGAFVWEMHRLGCPVGGIDQSAALVDIAKFVMPGASFAVADAADLPGEPPADVVLSSGVFGYFPSLEYARIVLERMAAKARRSVLLLDVPDSALREEALAHRMASVGGAEIYADRYAGLDHLYYSRKWIEEVMDSCGLHQVHTADQSLTGYGNARFRFNAWGFHNLGETENGSRGQSG